MSNSVSYNYNPGDNVYVINTLGPNGQYPYWGYPYGGCLGYPYSGPIGYQNNYPNGFTSTTPAIQSGVVLQTRILLTTTAPSPTIVYDVRIDSEAGVVVFPEANVFPATPGTTGSQTVDFGGTLTNGTVIVQPSASYSATIYIDGTPHVVTIDLSTTANIAAFNAAMNTALATLGVVSLASGNLVVTSDTIGQASSIVIIDAAVNPLFGSLPGFVGFNTATPGTPSGLELATAAYDILVQ